jgi:hypothetical protein
LKFTIFLLFSYKIILMSDNDKKFLLRKIKLFVVGGKDKNLIDTIEYLGFSDISIVESITESLEQLQSTFYGFIICTTSIDSAEFIKELRKNSTSLSRFTPILALLDKNDLSKELIVSIRDSGATEMMVSPFQIIPLREKIVSMIEYPRNFIISREYTGPDRRRKKLDVPAERRKHQKEPDTK